MIPKHKGSLPKGCTSVLASRLPRRAKIREKTRCLLSCEDMHCETSPVNASSASITTKCVPPIDLPTERSWFLQVYSRNVRHDGVAGDVKNDQEKRSVQTTNGFCVCAHTCGGIEVELMKCKALQILYFSDDCKCNRTRLKGSQS